MQGKENQRIPVRAAQELRLRAPEQRKLKSEKLAAEFKSAYSWSMHVGTKEHVAQTRRMRRPSSELNSFEKSTFHSIKRPDSH